MDLLNGVSDATITGAITGGGLLLLVGMLWVLAFIYETVRNHFKNANQTKQNHQFARIALLGIGALLLFYSLLVDNDWGTNDEYYEFLRLYVFCVGLYYAVIKLKEDRLEQSVLGLALSILFNPFLPLDLSSEGYAQFISGGIFAFLTYQEKKSVTSKSQTSVRNNWDDV